MNKKINSAAASAVDMARDMLVVKLRFMDAAIHSLQLTENEKIKTICTNGRLAAYNPVFLLKSYKRCTNLPVRQYLHLLVHCIFRHPFMERKLERDCWDLACDIAAEGVILGLELDSAALPDDPSRSKEIEELKGRVKYFTAEYLYRYFLDNRERMPILSSLFKIDDHFPWYMHVRPGDDDMNSSEDDNGNMSSSFSGIVMSDAELKELKKHWHDISEKLMVDLEMFAKKRGYFAGRMVQELKELNRDRCNYADFLRKFSVSHEAVDINDNEYDNIFYTYGLSLYERMPLIEPLEYKEVKRIKDFVIAIDTSGSTAGHTVQTFMEKTYNILMQQESFFTKINLYMLQCDSVIQDIKKITDVKEFEQYAKDMKIRGLGGTDFRPVFGFVNKLIDEGELTELKGMIYFTDADGPFPKRRPDYDVAVVYVEDGMNNYNVPPWVIKIMLRSDDIENI